jgi:YD repeat-containing protein
MTPLNTCLKWFKFQKRAGGYSEYSRVKVGYDNNGNIKEIISPEGNAHPELVEQYTTRYLYDEQNRLSKIEYPKTNKDEVFNPCKVYFYNDLTNEVTVLDENSNKTIIKKDPVGRVVEEIAGSDSPDQVAVLYSYDSLGNKITETIDGIITTRFEYNDLNQLVHKVLPLEKVLNDPNGQPVEKNPVYRYEYNVEGNLVKEVSPLGTVISHVYDELNRKIETYTEFTKLDGSMVTSSTKTYYDLAGNKIKVVDANGKATEMTYTAQGLLATQQDPMGGLTSYQYDQVGNKISETDPRGNTPTATPNSYTAWYYYDDLYRLVKGVLPDQTPPTDSINPGDNPVITFAYDRNGNCIKETKANGQEVNYKYNGRNWIDEQNQTLDGQTYTTRYIYDGMGNQRSIYDNKGYKTEYRYDPLNRLAVEIFPEGNIVEYEYDNRGNKYLIRDGKHNATKFIYNNLNLLSQVIDARGNTTTNWYNEEGQMTKTVTPTGLVTKFYPNELGLPLKVEDSLGQFRLFDFDVAGNTVYKKDPRGTETTLVYDDLYRVLRTDLRNGTKHQYLSYDYDQVGNIKQADNGEVKLFYNNADQNYESNPFNRITKITQVLADGAQYNTELLNVKLN